MENRRFELLLAETQWLRGLPDMLSASEGRGGHGKLDIVSKGGCVNFMLQISSDKRGRGVKKSKNFVDVISASPLIRRSRA